MINPYFIKAMENANQKNLGTIINALTSSENFELKEEEAISNLVLSFEPNYEVRLINHLKTPNVTESAKEYLSKLLNLKGIKKTDNGYTINTQEIPQLNGFNNQTLKSIGLSYSELANYIVSANN